MVLRLLIDAVHPDESRVVIADNSRILDFDFVTSAKKQVKGNIYLAKITRVEPSLQAAFVEYGGSKQGFLPFAEIHPDYYQIPMADRKRLLEEAEADEPEDTPHTHADEQNGHGADHADAQPGESHPHHAEEAPASYYAPEEPSQEQYGQEQHGHEQPGQEQLLQEQPAFMQQPAILPQSFEIPSVQDNAPPPEQPESQQEQPMGQAGDVAEQQPAEAHGEPPEAQEIETLASDEDAVRSARPASFYRRYKIQEVIKRNQIVLVQVIKEERGNKGVSLTTFISLAGRYCVLMPNSPKGGGISRKIMSGEDRKRLKEISAELKTARGMSAIIRTAGIDRTRAEIKRDYEYLVRLWETIREQTLSSTAPALIYEEGDLIKRTIRDLYSTDIEEVIVEGEEGYNAAKDFMKMILPVSSARVKLYQNNVPLFYAYNIEDQLSSMYDPVVKLRSGGYIVLNPTEALISIDVNSGRMTGERNIEETATKTNLEAVQEIARQLRLRDLAGLIVIDLIDMMDSRNRRAVERALKDALKLDRAKIQLGRISAFGLLEMSRQRLRPSIAETSSMPCPHCQGKGLIRSDASVAIQVIRAMEKEAASGLLGEIRLTVPPSVALHLLNVRRDGLTSLEEKYGVRVQITTDVAMAQSQFRLEKIRSQNKRVNNNPPPVSVSDPGPVDPAPIEDVTPEEIVRNDAPDSEVLVASESPEGARGDDRPRRRGRRGGRGRRNGKGERFDRPAGEEGMSEMQAEAPAIDGQAGAGEPAFNESRPREERPERQGRGERGGRRRRGGGGGGRWREPKIRQDGINLPPANGNSSDHAPPHEPMTATAHEASRPSLPQMSQAPSIPPLTEQMPADAKPKKGWWRRIVES